MSDDKLLKKIEEMMVANNNVLLNAMANKIQASEQRIKNELSQQIKATQQDTIDALSDLIHTGYDMHEARIQRVENELHLPPLKH